MSHFNDAFKKLFPDLAPLVDAAERDMQEMEEAEERRLARFEAEREERRRAWDERRSQFLGKRWGRDK